jgi:hypothetical protein
LIIDDSQWLLRMAAPPGSGGLELLAGLNACRDRDLGGTERVMRQGPVLSHWQPLGCPRRFARAISWCD